MARVVVWMALVAGIGCLMAAAQEGAPAPADAALSSRYVYSFRIIARWLHEDAEIDSLTLAQRPIGPVTREQFYDEAELERIADPNDECDVRISPVYTIVCGPGLRGVLEMESERGTFTVAARVTPVEEGLQVLDEVDWNGLNSPGTNIQVGGGESQYLGYSSKYVCLPGGPSVTVTQNWGPEDCDALAHICMVEPAWP